MDLISLVCLAKISFFLLFPRPPRLYRAEPGGGPENCILPAAGFNLCLLYYAGMENFIKNERIRPFYMKK
jgi:hypothetical protein